MRLSVSLVVVFLIFISFPLMGQNTTALNLVAEISTGKQLKELGFTIGNEGGLPPSPLCFFFVEDATVGVIDRVNRQVQFYSKDTWEHQRVVEQVAYPAFSNVHNVGGNYWLYSTRSAFLVDNSFALIKKIEAKSIFSFLDRYLWTFNTSGRLECYDENGVWIDEDKTRDLLRKLNSDIYSGKRYTARIRDAIKSLIETGKYLIVHGNILPRTLEQAQEFYSIFENSEWRSPSKDLRSTAPSRVEVGTLLDLNMSDDGSTVWSLTDKKQRSSFVGVFSAFGDLVAIFSDDEINPSSIRKGLLAENKKPSFDQFIAPVARIDPVGNIYYMVGFPDGIQFYEAKRTW